MKLSSALLAVAPLALFSAGTAGAEEVEKTTGYYFTVGAGAAWSQNVDASHPDYASRWSTGEIFYGSIQPKFDLNAGFAGETGLGYDFGDLRAELTYVYASASVESVTGSGRESGTVLGRSYAQFPYDIKVSGKGSFSTNSVFVSGYYDISTGGALTPYLGGGLGYTSVTVPGQSGSIPATLNGIRYPLRPKMSSAGGSAGALGYQAKVGLSYAAKENTDIFVEGTYQGSTSVTVNGIDYSGLNSFGARAGVRFRFGT